MFGFCISIAVCFVLFQLEEFVRVFRRNMLHGEVIALIIIGISVPVSSLCVTPVLADDASRGNLIHRSQSLAPGSSATVQLAPGVQPAPSPALSAPFLPLRGAFEFIYKQMDNDGDDDFRFVQSFAPLDDCAIYGGFKNAAYTYDQALVVLALLARHDDDDLRRARLLADSFLQAQDHDPDFQREFREGQLRNGYWSGKLLVNGHTRLPYGVIPSEPNPVTDQLAAGSDTGAMAWAALALVQAHLILKEKRYLDAALSLGNWILNHTADKNAGFTIGLSGFPSSQYPDAFRDRDGRYRESSRSTRHNIDLAVLFDYLASVDPISTDKWKRQASFARSFVTELRSNAMYYWIGKEEQPRQNVTDMRVIALDVQIAIVLQERDSAHADQNRPALDWAMKNCRARDQQDAFDFNCGDGDGVWWEGTAKVAAALHWLGRDKEAEPIRAQLEHAQLKQGTASGAIPLASKCGVTTGLDLVFRRPNGTIGDTKPWRLSNWPHLGATAWFIFAELGVNPYYVANRSISRR